MEWHGKEYSAMRIQYQKMKKRIAKRLWRSFKLELDTDEKKIDGRGEEHKGEQVNEVPLECSVPITSVVL